MGVLHKTKNVEALSKEREDMSNIELSYEQRKKILSLIDNSLRDRATMLNNQGKLAIKLNSVCCVAMMLISRHSNRSIINMFQNGMSFKDWYLLLAILLLSLSVSGLYKFCISPFIELYFGDLAKLRKYISKGKARAARDVVPKNNKMLNSISSIEDLTAFKLNLIKHDVMYTEQLTKRTIKKDKRDELAGNYVVFQDVDSLAKQLESGERLILSCKPIWRRHKIMLSTSL